MARFCEICITESQISCFMGSAVQNTRFDFSEFAENARQCIIFSIAICTFYLAHVMLIPQAPLFDMCFGTQICVFHEFHAPHASEMLTLCFPNVFGLKSIRNCRFQPKTRVFLQILHVFAQCVSQNPKCDVPPFWMFKLRNSQKFTTMILQHPKHDCTVLD